MAPVHQWEWTRDDTSYYGVAVVRQEEAERAIEQARREERDRNYIGKGLGLTQVYDAVREAVTNLWTSNHPGGAGPYGTLERIASHLNDLNQLHEWDLPPIPHPVNDHDLDRREMIKENAGVPPAGNDQGGADDGRYPTLSDAERLERFAEARERQREESAAIAAAFDAIIARETPGEAALFRRLRERFATVEQERQANEAIHVLTSFDASDFTERNRRMRETLAGALDGQDLKGPGTMSQPADDWFTDATPRERTAHLTTYEERWTLAERMIARWTEWAYEAAGR